LRVPPHPYESDQSIKVFPHLLHVPPSHPYESDHSININ
jgi:hypothetical protein